jgi:hypothetical protein
MIHKVELVLMPQEAEDTSFILQKILSTIDIHESSITHWHIIRRSIDARSRTPKIILLIEVFQYEDAPPDIKKVYTFKQIDGKKSVIIIGAGPAGYFAALKLLEHGIKPIVLERGKDARSRRRDLRAIQQDGIVNPDSNYCFGEGGAGTYSDGKLWTNAKKRGDIEKVLQLLVQHGAHERILVDTHPHIGSNKLPGIIQNIRSTIETYGGEVHFESKVTDFIINKSTIKGVIVNGQLEYYADAVILATGHSARDIFYLLKEKNILIESKPFALGVRAEHPQQLIDEIQYKQKKRDPYLPPSTYKQVCHIAGRGVFSFCMCPGGLIVPAATAPGEIVVNGMSMSRRDSAFANSGIVVAIEQDDLSAYQQYGALAGLEFQKDIEQKVFSIGDGSQKAPAQSIPHFISQKTSSRLPKTSYIPGIYSANIADILPKGISDRLQMGFEEIGKKMKGYIHQESIIVATESRTSSPVRIPRHHETKEHLQIQRLFPCGEGAGYAGGIISAAMDGQNTSEAIAILFGYLHA